MMFTVLERDDYEPNFLDPDGAERSPPNLLEDKSKEVFSSFSNQIQVKQKESSQFLSKIKKPAQSHFEYLDDSLIEDDDKSSIEEGVAEENPKDDQARF